MRRTIAGLAAAALAAAACSRGAQVVSTGDVAPTATVSTSAIPSGTTMQVRLDNAIGTGSNKVGDQFTATVTQALRSSNGTVVVPEGTKVQGKVTGLHASERAGDQAAISLDFQSININGQSYPFNANITSTDLKTSGGDTKQETLQKAGVGAAAGAVLGAVLSKGDLEKILIGGALGAAAGTAISLGTGDVEASLPAGSLMTLQSTQTVALR